MGRRIEIPYEGLLDIPEAKVGAFEIKHKIFPANKPIPTSNIRTSLYGGHPAKPVTYDHDVRFHQLLEDGGVWTTDFPIEQWQQRQSLLGFRGKVLIGGLGLGVVVQILKKYKNVTRIDVVEQSHEVADLVWKYVDDGVRTRLFWPTDLFDFLRDAQGLQYDHAFFDIWTSDGEGTLFDVVIPLRKLARPLVKGKVTCWNEDVMRGQFAQSLRSPVEINALNARNRDEHKIPDYPTLEELAESTTSVWHARKVPFYQSLLTVKADLSDPVDLETCRQLAGVYALNFDDTPEFAEKWAHPLRLKDRWEFAQMYCRQLVGERQAKAS